MHKGISVKERRDGRYCIYLTKAPGMPSAVLWGGRLVPDLHIGGVKTPKLV